VATISQEQHRGNHDRHQRWARLERAELFERYGELHTQGLSQRQAAKVLDVPLSTLQAWRMYQDRLDACPTVVAFFQSVPGLAFSSIAWSSRCTWCVSRWVPVAFAWCVSYWS